MLVYAAVALIYGLVLIPILLALGKSIRELTEQPRSAEILEGVAVGCLIAVAAGLLLTSGTGVRGGMLIWLTYLAATSVAIWLPSPISLRHAVFCATAPSLVLLGTLLSVYFIPIWLGQAAGLIVSQESQNIGTEQSSVRAFLLTLFTFVTSIIGTTIGIYGRNKIVAISKALLALDPDAFGNLEKSLNTCVRIGMVLLGIFAIAQSP